MAQAILYWTDKIVYLFTKGLPNSYVMKGTNYCLLLLIILAVGCGQENTCELENLNEGEFVIKLYNTSGDLLLTKKGNAENFSLSGDHWELRLLDSDFGLENADPLKTFAFLTIFGEAAVTTPRVLQVNNGNRAVFSQRWYSLEDDWGYKSVNGTVNITSLEGSKVKGSFEINLEVADNAFLNPLWGERILAKGHFSSICPYADLDVCPE